MKMAQTQANGKLEPAQTADESGCECVGAFYLYLCGFYAASVVLVLVQQQKVGEI